MELLLRSNDIVLISFIKSLLNDAGIEYFAFDEHMSGVEGLIGIFPRRILVDGDLLTRARRVLQEADLGHHLAPLPQKRS